MSGNENLTVQQLRDIKKLASDLGAVSCNNVSGATAVLNIPGSAVTGDILGNATAVTNYTTSEDDDTIQSALAGKLDTGFEASVAVKAKKAKPGSELDTILEGKMKGLGDLQATLYSSVLECKTLEITQEKSLTQGSFSAGWAYYYNAGWSHIEYWNISQDSRSLNADWYNNSEVITHNTSNTAQDFRYYSFKCWYGILANALLLGQGAVNHSDARIKMNIEDVPDTLALDQVRQIPCRYYEYKDKLDRGAGKTVGFIAQEVKEVLPMAVKTTREFVPDHMRVAEVSWEEVDGKHLMTVSNLDADVISGTRVRFAAYTGTPPELNEDGSVKTPASDDFNECKKDVLMREDGKFEMDKAYDGVFIIGREVDDFLAIDKAKIFALHHSAIQELDKTMEARKTTISALEQQNASKQAAIDSLMARVAALKGQ